MPNHKDILKRGLENGTFGSKLYKYRDFNEFTDSIILKSEFYFSSPKYFNDPFDCNLSFKTIYTRQEINTMYKRFIDRNPTMTMKKLKQNIGYKSKKFYEFCLKNTTNMKNKAGILSLSKNCENITMWSHYSNNHKGLVFELDVCEDLDFFELYGEVNYKDNYDVLSFEKDNREELVKLFLTKYTDWMYEDEVRIIDYERNGTRKFNKKVLTTIIFGYKSEKKNISNMINLCKNNGFEHIKFKKAKLIPGKFALDFVEIKKEDFL